MALRKELHLFGAPPMAINQTECLDEGATGFLLHVAIDGGPWDAPQNGDLRPRGLVDDDDQTETTATKMPINTPKNRVPKKAVT